LPRAFVQGNYEVMATWGRQGDARRLRGPGRGHEIARVPCGRCLEPAATAALRARAATLCGAGRQLPRRHCRSCHGCGLLRAHSTCLRGHARASSVSHRAHGSTAQANCCRWHFSRPCMLD